MPIGYAVVGLGRFAQGRVLPALRKLENSRPAALVSGDPEKAGSLADRFEVPHVYTYDSFDRLADNDEIDAVYIALPNSLHWKYALDAAAMGKHVLVEKPMANSPAECLSMIEACRRNGVKLMVGYRVHFDPGNQEAIRLIRDGAIGNPKFIQSAFSQCTAEPGHWRLDPVLSGGGSLVDIGIYCINACRYLLGSEPVSTVGMVSSTMEAFDEVEENAMAIFRFPGDVLASIASSYGTDRVDYLTIDGSEGWLRLDHPFDYWTPRGLTLSRSGRTRVRELETGDQVAAEIGYFSMCIEADVEPSPSGEEGLRDVIAMEAVYRSARDTCAVPVSYQAVA